ncbi:hypothetical protein THASP1DRAFT_31585 [Thamnocephalis sphaerospora]|uniref:G-protein coupled receptors family 1 profile domain-containing protein n=1 Tax=Thamnocephalis sphaerospora TaxID=78915 RepID=A0A4V1IW77_9FUNG|nr:hypothetical protein THASP1DRAFT_31585 [Thamnocephalis sphaerospora]|eukprot:RKP06599.1 hypothetical protein THASP1DRAFT_31585 [Thamnocephalis sphaerospora]
MSPADDHTLIAASFSALEVSTTLVLTGTFWLFFTNLCSSARFLYARRHATQARLSIPIFNVVPNLIGSVTSLYALAQRAWPGAANCTMLFVLNTAMLAFGVSSITAILFIRAYYTWMQRTWLSHVGVLLVAASFAVGFSLFFVVPVHADEDKFCWVGTSISWSMAKFAIDMITNVTLSGLYLYVLRQTLRNGFSVPLYQKLYREGLVATFLVIASSIITAVLVLHRVAADYAAFIYGLDAVLNATIVNWMLCQRRGRTRSTPTEQVATEQPIQLDTYHVSQTTRTTAPASRLAARGRNGSYYFGTQPRGGRAMAWSGVRHDASHHQQHASVSSVSRQSRHSPAASSQTLSDNAINTYYRLPDGNARDEINL